MVLQTMLTRKGNLFLFFIFVFILQYHKSFMLGFLLIPSYFSICTFTWITWYLYVSFVFFLSILLIIVSYLIQLIHSLILLVESSFQIPLDIFIFWKMKINHQCWLVFCIVMNQNVETSKANWADPTQRKHYWSLSSRGK